ERAKTVVGVVKNFRWHSLHENHTGYVIELYEGRLTENISIRINTSDLPAAIAHIEERFQDFFPGNPFVYSFANESFDRQYKVEQQFGQLFLSFSILASLIACVGLFALVSYSASFRVKEIGIRKVLGASVRDLMVLLSNEYLKLILVAVALVIPIVWIGARSWLENYAYRISVGLDLFVVPCCLLLLVAVLTVGQKTLAAATANPVDSLRDE
ncbi:MAG: FtsX-like permease family protein, partial [Bacteroidota bacterium]